MSRTYLGKSYLTKEEKQERYYDYLRAKEYESNERARAERPGAPLLDSSLIFPTHFKYDMKIIECGEYIQVYFFENIKTKNKKEKKEIDVDNLYKNEETYKKRNDLLSSGFCNEGAYRIRIAMLS